MTWIAPSRMQALGSRKSRAVAELHQVFSALCEAPNLGDAEASPFFAKGGTSQNACRHLKNTSARTARSPSIASYAVVARDFEMALHVTDDMHEQTP